MSALPSGSAQAVVGALVFAMTGFGVGWVNAGADYSRYLPRSASGRGVVGWTTFGGSIAPVVLVVYGAAAGRVEQGPRRSASAPTRSER